jgi:allantoinase
MFDLLIKNARVVRPNTTKVESKDIGIHDGKFARVETHIEAGDARETIDANGLLAFPCLVDVHIHVGINSPLAQDAITESKAVAMGGVTTAITYFRTGAYYLNQAGRYEKFFLWQAVLDGKVVSTFVRGHRVFHNGEIAGAPSGRYVPRPV